MSRTTPRGSVGVPGAGAPLVSVRNLGRTYRRRSEDVVALTDVSFDLDAGELVVLTGPSGSGKTTLLNILAGWETHDDGELTWGIEGVDQRAPAWQVLAIAPQRLGLLEELTIRENVELPLRLAREHGEQTDGDRIGVALETFGLTHLAHRMPAEVSGGEQQRTALARALVVQPRLLLADEPTGHQDAAWAAGVLDGLYKAAAAGSAVMVATHDEEIIAQVSRELALRDGRLVGS
jgi:putative ABC transport system ATP-binding protein